MRMATDWCVHTTAAASPPAGPTRCRPPLRLRLPPDIAACQPPRRLWQALTLLLGLLLHGPVHALGAGAGTLISNSATMDYEIAGALARAVSNTVTLRVDEILDLDLTWQDAGNVAVATPDTARVLTYLLTNTGNGTDSYSLSVQNSAGTDQFDPVLADIYLDANGDGVFSPGVDVLYVAGVNDPVLAADAAQVVFVRCDIPGSLESGDLGSNRLVATSATGAGRPGTAIVNAGDNNTAAVVGSSGGIDAATGVYQVSNVTVVLLKSVTVRDLQGGSQPVTGATLTYSIDVSASGAAAGVLVTDPLPANTTYRPGTLTLNAAPLTDAADTDTGDVGATAPATVAVYLGDLSQATPVQTISFEVTIN